MLDTSIPMVSSLSQSSDHEEQDIELKQQEEDTKPDFLGDFIHAPFLFLKQSHWTFKLHLFVAWSCCLCAFFAFHYMTPLLSKSPPLRLFPWWLFFWLFFIMTLSAHHFYSKGNFLTGTVLLIIFLHIGMFITNKVLTPQYDWYWYTLLLALMYGMHSYYSQDPSTTKLRIISYLYLILSAMIFLTWINLYSIFVFPWFIYPIGLMGLPILLWYMYSVYSERRWYLYAVVVLFVLNGLFIITWGLLDTVWPWFFVPLVISMLISIFWWYFFTRGCIGGCCASCCPGKF